MVHPTGRKQNEARNGFRIENLSNDLPSPASIEFFAKIDDRGRIYLPSRIRQFLNGSASFFAAVAERRIFIITSGKYKVDSKNRIFIPADIRRSLGLNVGDAIKLEFGGVKNE